MVEHAEMVEAPTPAEIEAEWQALHPGCRRATPAEVDTLRAELDAKWGFAPRRPQHVLDGDFRPNWTRDRLKGAAGD